MSGAKDDRPGLAALMEYVHDGDTVLVWKLDRLGGDTLHILATVKALTDAGVTPISTTDGIDSSTAAGAHGDRSPGEHGRVRARTDHETHRPGAGVSRANGTKFGRRTKVADPVHVATARRMKADGHTARDVASFTPTSFDP
jgi:hypothetical protein